MKLKTKSAVALLCVAALLTAGGAAALAAADTSVPQTRSDAGETANGWLEPFVKTAKIDPDSRFKDMLDRWGALTDAQRSEAYAIGDRMASLRIELIDKYLELGLIDEAAAAQMKERVAEQNARVRKEGKMPGLCGGIKGREGRSFRFSKPDEGSAGSSDSLE